MQPKYELFNRSTGETYVWGPKVFATKVAAKKRIEYLHASYPNAKLNKLGIRVSRAENPARASLPVGKKIKVNYIVVKKDGTVQASVPTKALRNPAQSRRRNTEGFKDAMGRFHPIRTMAGGIPNDDYEPDEVGEKYQYKPRKATKKKAAKKTGGPLYRIAHPVSQPRKAAKRNPSIVTVKKSGEYWYIYVNGSRAEAGGPFVTRATALRQAEWLKHSMRNR